MGWTPNEVPKQPIVITIDMGEVTELTQVNQVFFHLTSFSDWKIQLSADENFNNVPMYTYNDSIPLANNRLLGLYWNSDRIVSARYIRVTTMPVDSSYFLTNEIQVWVDTTMAPDTTAPDTTTSVKIESWGNLKRNVR
jgi:hypothetical protein